MIFNPLAGFSQSFGKEKPAGSAGQWKSPVLCNRLPDRTGENVPQEFRIVPSRPEMAESLAAIQRACFPSISAGELITAEQYRAHMKVFPEGQMTVLNAEDRPVASSTDLRCTMDFDHYQHTYLEAGGNNWLSTHNPDGDWLYGVDIGVHPDYRRGGLSRLLYNARQDLARRLNLRGHILGGMMKGYGPIRNSMTPGQYVERLNSGEIFDPTVSVQMKRGYKIEGILENYVDDPSCAGKAALLVWRNPDYRA
jgi:GNAT superfamily N-acetyltransferase